MCVQTPCFALSSQPRAFPRFSCDRLLCRYNCDCVLGYSETVSYASDVCIMSVPPHPLALHPPSSRSACSRPLPAPCAQRTGTAGQPSALLCGCRRRTTTRLSRRDTARLLVRALRRSSLLLQKYRVFCYNNATNVPIFTAWSQVFTAAAACWAGGGAAVAKELCPAAMMHIPYKCVPVRTLAHSV